MVNVVPSGGWFGFCSEDFPLSRKWITWNGVGVTPARAVQKGNMCPRPHLFDARFFREHWKFETLPEKAGSQRGTQLSYEIRQHDTIISHNSLSELDFRLAKYIDEVESNLL